MLLKQHGHGRLSNIGGSETAVIVIERAQCYGMSVKVRGSVWFVHWRLPCSWFFPGQRKSILSGFFYNTARLRKDGPAT